MRYLFLETCYAYLFLTIYSYIFFGWRKIEEKKKQDFFFLILFNFLRGGIEWSKIFPPLQGDLEGRKMKFKYLLLYMFG